MTLAAAAALLALALLVAAAAVARYRWHRSEGALTVTHLPNPCPVNQPRGPVDSSFPYTWYYRTEVRNNLDRPLRIIRFEGYFLVEGEWVPSNILGRTLDSRVFEQWYAEGDAAPGGWIAPGKVAACDPNWTGFDTPAAPPMKWRYEAVDDGGNVFRAEAVVDLLPPGE